MYQNKRGSALTWQPVRLPPTRDPNADLRKPGAINKTMIVVAPNRNRQTDQWLSWQASNLALPASQSYSMTEHHNEIRIEKTTTEVRAEVTTTASMMCWRRDFGLCGIVILL